jgi:hypothetical protein
MVGLGDDLGEPISGDIGTSQELPAPAGGNSEDDSAVQSEAPFDPNTADLLRTDIATVPDEYRVWFEKAQAVAKNTQADFTRKTQDLAEERRQLEVQKQQAMLNAQTDTIRQELDARVPVQDPYASLSEDQRAAIRTVEEVVDRQTAEMRLKVEAMEAENTNLRSQVGQMVDARQSETQGALLREVNSAKAVYGDQLNTFSEPIAALVQSVNPKTGARYTVTEAMEAASGIPSQKGMQEEVARAEQVDQQTGFAARSSVTPPPPVTGVATAAGNGAIGRKDVNYELGKLGFEQ